MVNQIKKDVEKEKLIITVGRIGTSQKNTEMLLHVLEKIDLKQWKCYIIGPIEKSFGSKINRFYKKNPNLIHKIKFLGSLNKNEVNKYYAKSKIFLLTSLREGFPLVFPEALFFGNHIITTKVSGANDITNNGKYGDIIEINDIGNFSKVLQYYIDNEETLNKKCNDSLSYSKNFYWSYLIKKLKC